jgi:nitrite reductase (NADH) small subunit
MNQEANWIPITHSGNIPLREGRAVKLGSREVAIFNLGDRFLAIDNQCPHQGGPLCDGIVSGTTVVCPLHGWKIDLDAGTVNKPADVPACLQTFQVRVKDGIVLLEATAARPRKEEVMAV